MGGPLLTLLLTDPVEQDQSYLGLYLRALSLWNGDALSDVQLIVLSQRDDQGPAEELLRQHGVEAEVVRCRHDWVNGYPIWDMLSATSQVWDGAVGEYITWNHPEYIWGPGRLRNTIDWLRRERPIMALGNLRRPGFFREISAQKTADHCIISRSEQLRRALLNGHDHDAAERLYEAMPTTWWMFWSPEQKPGLVPYIEDVFFADHEWLDSWQFTKHGGELPFQDIYDLMRVAMHSVFPKYGLAFQCHRMTQDVNRIIHLWHPKRWLSWSPEIRDWFLSDPARWQGMKVLDREMWNQLISVRIKMPKNHNIVNVFRNAPTGTVTRYATELSKWLSGGGAAQIQSFYDQRSGKQDTISA